MWCNLATMRSSTVLFLSYRKLSLDPRARRLSEHFLSEGFSVLRVCPERSKRPYDFQLRRRNLLLRFLALYFLPPEAAAKFLFGSLVHQVESIRTKSEVRIIFLADVEWLLEIPALRQLYPTAKIVVDIYENYLDFPDNSKVEKLYSWIFRSSRQHLRDDESLDFVTHERGALYAYSKYFGKPGVLVRNSRQSSEFVEGNFELERIGEIRFVHHGFLGSNRGISQYLQILSFLPQSTLTIFTPSSRFWRASLRFQNMSLILQGRLKVCGPIPYESLPQRLSNFDLGLCLITGTDLNATLALPNKVFDYVAAGLPFLAGPGVPLIDLASELGQFSLRNLDAESLRSWAKNLTGASLVRARSTLRDRRGEHSIDKELAALSARVLASGS